VPHSERYLAPPAGLQEARKLVRIVIDGWPGDVVLIRDVDVIISYTLAHSAHRLTGTNFTRFTSTEVPILTHLCELQTEVSRRSLYYPDVYADVC
jgi:hypothetical protein